MIKFIKENWFKIVIIIVLLISINVYNKEKQDQQYKEKQDQQYKEKQNKTEFEFKMKEKCKNICNKTYQDMVKECDLIIPISKEFTYNSDLNTCLYYSSEYLDNGFLSRTHTRVIVDCFSNKEIIISEYEGYKLWSGVNYLVFNKRKCQLFPK